MSWKNVSVLDSRKGMCKTCVHSERIRIHDEVDSPVHQYCWHYRSWCQSVARNCLGPTLNAIDEAVMISSAAGDR